MACAGCAAGARSACCRLWFYELARRAGGSLRGLLFWPLLKRHVRMRCCARRQKSFIWFSPNRCIAEFSKGERLRHICMQVSTEWPSRDKQFRLCPERERNASRRCPISANLGKRGGSSDFKITVKPSHASSDAVQNGNSAEKQSGDSYATGLTAIDAGAHAAARPPPPMRTASATHHRNRRGRLLRDDGRSCYLLMRRCPGRRGSHRTAQLQIKRVHQAFFASERARNGMRKGRIMKYRVQS